MQDVLIKVNDVSKAYGGRAVLAGVDLSIYKGQSVAFTGHNGSGKSTLLKMLAGLVRADAGSIHYRRKLKFNYVPEHFPKLNFSARSYITHMGTIEGLGKQDAAERGRALFQSYYMDDMQDIPMKNLSKGTLQKVCVIQALLTRPDVLLLDEPLAGQDTDSQEVFIRQVNALHKAGVTVLMACHEKFLISRLSDSAYEIRDGKLYAIPLSDMQASEYDILFFEHPVDAAMQPPEFDSGMTVQHVDGLLKISVPSEKSGELIVQMIQAGWSLRGMRHESGR